MMFTASSTETAQDGFQYKVDVYRAAPGDIASFYKPPNPDGVCILDLSLLMRMVNAVEIGGVPIHALLAPTQEPTGFGRDMVQIFFEEAWIVAGVLTDQGTPVQVEDYEFWNAVAQARDGMPLDLDRYELDGPTKNWLSDRRWNTSLWPGGQDQSTSKVFIPVREADYGVLTIGPLLGQTVDNIQVTIFASNGTPNAFDVTSLGPMYHYPFYPANLNNSVEAGWEKPSDYPGWRYIQIRAETPMGGDVVSVNYILYNTAVYGPSDCRHDVVRVGWKNSAGGWDYFNFTKRNQITNQIENKRYRAVLGDYGSTYTMTGMERGLTELDKIVEQTLDATSDWMTEGEFLFLRSLFVSKQVHWLQDDGTFIPVVVEDTGYTEQRGRNGKLVNQQIKLKMANEYWT